MITRPLAALSAMFIALSAGLALSQPAQASPTPPPDPALKQAVTENEKMAKGPAEIKRGHVDVGPRIVDGKFTLMARDDTANPPVWRSTDDAVLRVVDASRIDVPNDETYSFLGDMRGTKAYVIPQTQNQQVVWLGWNTQAAEIVKNFPRGADLVFTGHEGPGQAHMFIENGFDAPTPLYDSTKSGEQLVHMETNTHVHANWVFSDPGAQTISVAVRGTDAEGTKHSYSTTLRFVVGDKGSADEARAMGASATPDFSASVEASASSSSAASAPEKVSSSPAATHSAADSGNGTTWGTIVAVLAGVVIIGFIVAAVVLRSKSKKMRDEVWNNEGASPTPVKNSDDGTSSHE
ncbi:choice-of-anchor M domain-containing protein [Cutibacterium modestum]|uniref:choice-of-anchor M domain-containing protein n=1 Tax=Cutibacterium modestum TaxID=2559073 RepID=UPI000F065EE2|nr:choice-of-anchor M domain-containing protein [Cutibacterium modestum]MCP2377304.1 actinobacterial surface-anchored protein domain protein [Cutibacterium modestum 31N]